MLKPGHRFWMDNEKVRVEFDNENNPSYRYVLECKWEENQKVVTFIMLNPSVADNRVCDPTLNRCVDYAKSWGFGGMNILNLFAFISPNPKDLLKVKDPIGEKNDEIIDRIISSSDEIVFAWGSDYGHYHGRNMTIVEKLKEHKPKCIFKSKKGHPRHPLFLKKGLQLIEY
ncbi:DUF1643 domain-containing protein [Bacillus tianshenii]|uniref:DUF1643 domain-containing protein n=1 Tax=Sutcliffiella tianshenii TaxID=1463404 RepID=UPI001CD33DE3|nr:DUF1643 domain-containing protein [Bacillus tianshenii]MCA1318393.1 DUF1643 domain-containing protein [Bacillus tianshenii]